MDLVDKVEEARDDRRMKRMKSKLQESANETLTLRELNRTLQQELDRLSAARPRRRRRWVWTSLGLGCAYVLGARAGRTRYQQIRHWAKAAMDRARGKDLAADSVSTPTDGIGWEPPGSDPVRSKSAS
jgi:hypothetical protein